MNRVPGQMWHLETACGCQRSAQAALAQHTHGRHKSPGNSCIMLAHSARTVVRAACLAVPCPGPRPVQIYLPAALPRLVLALEAACLSQSAQTVPCAQALMGACSVCCDDPVLLLIGWQPR